MYKRFETIPVNKSDHEKIDRAAEWTREHFPWFVKLANMFIKKDA